MSAWNSRGQRAGLDGLLRRLFGRMFLCPLNKHRRSASEVRQSGDLYVSHCRNCGVPMIRLSKRNWVVDDRRKG